MGGGGCRCLQITYVRPFRRHGRFACSGQIDLEGAGAHARAHTNAQAHARDPFPPALARSPRARSGRCGRALARTTAATRTTGSGAPSHRRRSPPAGALAARWGWRMQAHVSANTCTRTHTPHTHTHIRKLQAMDTPARSVARPPTNAQSYACAHTYNTYTSCSEHACVCGRTRDHQARPCMRMSARTCACMRSHGSTQRCASRARDPLSHAGQSPFRSLRPGTWPAWSLRPYAPGSLRPGAWPPLGAPGSLRPGARPRQPGAPGSLRPRSLRPPRGIARKRELGTLRRAPPLGGLPGRRGPAKNVRGGGCRSADAITDPTEVRSSGRPVHQQHRRGRFDRVVVGGLADHGGHRGQRRGGGGLPTSAAVFLGQQGYFGHAARRADHTPPFHLDEAATLRLRIFEFANIPLSKIVDLVVHVIVCTHVCVHTMAHSYRHTAVTYVCMHSHTRPRVCVCTYLRTYVVCTCASYIELARTKIELASFVSRWPVQTSFNLCGPC